MYRILRKDCYTFIQFKMESSPRDAELENYLDALNDFVKKPNKKIPTSLEELIRRIARHGEPLFPWIKLKPLIVAKLENVIEEYIEFNPHEDVPILPNVENVRFDEMRERLLKALESFNSAPFTIQRLCELLTEPKRYYRRSDKFMRGIEKNVQVVSTITPSGKRITSLFELQKGPPLMNGIVAGAESPTRDSDNNGFVRPDSDAFSIPSSSSSKVDSMNGVSHPYYQGDPMDAPLQFSYPLGQPTVAVATTIASSAESSERTDISTVDDLQSSNQQDESKESSEAIPDVPQEESIEMDSRTSEERTEVVVEETGDVDTASVVSSSDVESFSGDGLRRDEEEEMEVDVASSEDAGSMRRERDSVDLKEDTQELQKDADVSTSESSSSLPEDTTPSKEDPGKADSSEDQGSKSPTVQSEDSFSTNSEAASMESAETQDDGRDESPREPEQEQASSGQVPEEPECGGDLEAGTSSSGDVGPSGDAGPADSSNGVQAFQQTTSDENNEADSKASSPEAQEPRAKMPRLVPEDNVQSSADATAGVLNEPQTEPHSDGVTGSTASNSTEGDTRPTPDDIMQGEEGNEASAEETGTEQVQNEESVSSES